MRAEEKELEGPELAHELSREEQREATPEREEEMPEATQDVRDLQLDSRSRLLDALRLILAGEQVNVTLLYLPQRETHALEALQTAVKGNDSVGEFVFAEDRRVLLEQALAVLQQNLTHGEPEQIAELHSKFDSMTERVAELRHELTNLEDAQEQIDEFHNAARELLAGGAGDKDDKADTADADKADKPKADTGLLDFLAEALFAIADVSPSKTSTLAGEERKVEPPTPSSLTHGPEIPAKREQPSTLVGPELPQKPKPPSTLVADVPDSATPTHDPSPQRRKVLPKPEPEKKK